MVCKQNIYIYGLKKFIEDPLYIYIIYSYYHMVCKQKWIDDLIPRCIYVLSPISTISALSVLNNSPLINILNRDYIFLASYFIIKHFPLGSICCSAALRRPLLPIKKRRSF